MQIGPFHIDEATSSDDKLFVDVAGLGTVSIGVNHEGIFVDILPLHVSDDSVASCYAFNSDLIKQE